MIYTVFVRISILAAGNKKKRNNKKIASDFLKRRFRSVGMSQVLSAKLMNLIKTCREIIIVSDKLNVLNLNHDQGNDLQIQKVYYRILDPPPTVATFSNHSRLVV